MARLKKIFAAILATMLMSTAVVEPQQANADEQFKQYEIRVIRPKYFKKSGRFELGAQLTAIMNEAFVYTFLATGLMTFHFSESFAIEGMGGYGFSVDREEKDVLFRQFDIRTQIFRTLYLMSAALQWTPIYGKWQLPSGKVIYFDSYFLLGGGLTGIEWRYSDFCVSTKATTEVNSADVPIPADQTIGYPTGIFGFGQRYFVDRSLAIKWDLRGNLLIYNVADTACDPQTAVQGQGNHYNINMQIGASKFF